MARTVKTKAPAKRRGGKTRLVKTPAPGRPELERRFVEERPTAGPFPPNWGSADHASDAEKKKALEGLRGIIETLQGKPASASMAVRVRREAKYSHENYAKLVKATVENIETLSRLKGGEYAGGDDRLANFRRNAENLKLPMESVWAIYAAKHWDAIMQFVQDIVTGKERTRLETLDGRCDDLIVYLILFKAMLQERQGALNIEGAV